MKFEVYELKVKQSKPVYGQAKYKILSKKLLKDAKPIKKSA